MKDIYPYSKKKFSLLIEKSKEIFLAFTKELRNDFCFHNSHTELLMIWTALLITITGLFVLAINSNIFIIFLLFFLAIAIMFATTFATIYYLHALKYQNANRLLPKIHSFLNKSFNVKSIFRFLKIPRTTLLDNLSKIVLGYKE